MSGYYNLTVNPGTIEVTANATDYYNDTKTIDTSQTKTVDFSLSSKFVSVQGQVRNQYGEPVENATVEAWGSLASVAAAKEELNDLSDPIPTEFEDQLNDGFQLEGPSGFSASQSSNYAAIFTQSDWPSGLTFDDPSLSPKWRNIEPGQKLVLTSWDPTRPRSGGIDEELTGQTTDTPVVVEQISGSGNLIDRQVYDLDQTYSTASATWNPLEVYKTHHYAEITLSAGIYRIYAQGAPGAGYSIKVGDPKPAIDDALQTNEGVLTDQAQNVRDKLASGDLERYTATTDADGNFAIDVSDSLNLVYLQAFKQPASLQSVDPANAKLSDLRNYSAAGTYNGSFALPSRVKTAEPPKSGVTLAVSEFSAPRYTPLGRYQNKSEWAEDYVSNLSYSDLNSGLQDRLDTLNRTDLEDTNEKLEEVVNQNEELRQKFRDLCGEDYGVNTDTCQVEVNESDATEDQLRNRIGELEETISGLRDTIEEGDGELTRGNETISWTKRFQTSLDEEDVLVLVHYTNGTTDTLTTDSEYVSIDSTLVPGRGDAVVVSDLPLGDAAGAGIEVVVANEDGTGSARRTVTNPAFNGQIPGLESIAFSSLNPGPSEPVTIELNPDDDTTIQNISSVEVYGPDGSTVPAEVTGENAARFTTAGQGPYKIRAKFQDLDGNQFTVVQRVKAGNIDVKVPPGIRAEQTPYGTIAIVGDGLDGGSVDVEDGGAQVQVVAQAPSGSEIPSEVHVYTESLSLLSAHETQVSVVQGDQQTSVGKHVKTTIHEPDLDTSSEGVTNFAPIFYRNEEPLPRGSSSTGVVKLNETKTTIETYTDSNGQVAVRTIEDPSLREWAQYRIDTFEIDIPVIGSLTFPVGE